jgi:hypothetical protein
MTRPGFEPGPPRWEASWSSKHDDDDDGDDDDDDDRETQLRRKTYIRLYGVPFMMPHFHKPEQQTLAHCNDS